jgi:hypothetical protein
MATALIVATGTIHPEGRGWHFDDPQPMTFDDGAWTVSIQDSQFQVVTVGQPPDDLKAFRNDIVSIVQGCLDSLGFLLAAPLQAEIRTISVQRNDSEQIQLSWCRQEWPELLGDRVSWPPRVEGDDLQPLVAATVAEPLIRLALVDLRAALQYPDDTLVYAYRAVESVRQWFLEEHEVDDDAARKRAWKAMRKALQLPRGPVDDPIDRLKDWSVGRRHGALAPPTEAQRKEALLTARNVVRTFIDYLNAGPPGGGESPR